MTRAIVLIALGFLAACGQSEPEPNLSPYERYILAEIEDSSSEQSKKLYRELLAEYRSSPASLQGHFDRSALRMMEKSDFEYSEYRAAFCDRWDDRC